MDSFVLAETFKYLYLLFSDKEDIILDIDDFIFTTEAHLLPLSLSVGNFSWMMTPTISPDVNKHETMSVVEMSKVTDDDISPGSTVVDNFIEEESMCHNYHVTISQGPGYPHRLRHQLKDFVNKSHPQLQTEAQRLKAGDFVAGNKEHLAILHNMGIQVVTMPDGRIQLLHTSSEALSQAYAEAGLQFMQEMIFLSKSHKPDSQHEPMFVKFMPDPTQAEIVYRAGPSQFGYDLSKNAPIHGSLVFAEPFKACSDIENSHDIMGKIAIVERGSCLFIDKARNLQQNGAIGGIVFDQTERSSSELQNVFAMSGDGTSDVTIPMVFLFWKQAQELIEILKSYPSLTVELTSKSSINDEVDTDQRVITPFVTSDTTRDEVSAPSVCLPSP